MAGVLSHLFPQSRQRDSEIEREYLLALRLNPASADTRHGYANFLSDRRRSDEAIAQYREALLLDPLSPNFMGRLGMELAANGQVEEGMDLMRRAVEIEPWQFNAHVRLGWAYALSDNTRRRQGLCRRRTGFTGQPAALAGRSFVASRTGDKASATAGLEELQAQAETLDAPFLVAIVYVGLQDRDDAFKWLEKAASSSTTMPSRGGLFRLDNSGLRLAAQ